MVIHSEALHVGRSWSGHEIEDACPCPQAPCGLVSIGSADPACEHHPITRAKAMRQGHPASACPAAPQTSGREGRPGERGTT